VKVSQHNRRILKSGIMDALTKGFSGVRYCIPVVDHKPICIDKSRVGYLIYKDFLEKLRQIK